MGNSEEYIYYIHDIHVKDAHADGTVVTAGNGEGNIPAITKAFIGAGGNSFTIEPHLTVFEGFSHLEKAEGKSVIENNTFRDSNTAFDAACAAFRTVLENVLDERI